MGMSLHVAAVDEETLEALTADTAITVLLEGWSADHLGWAVGGLLFGERGIGAFGPSASDRFGPQVQIMSEVTLMALAANVPGPLFIATRRS